MDISSQAEHNRPHRLRAILLVMFAVVAASYFAERGRAVAPNAGEECVPCKLYAPPVWEFARDGAKSGKPIVPAQDFVDARAK